MDRCLTFRTTPAKLLAAAGRDKKNRAGTRRFILPKGIGNAIVVEDVTETELQLRNRLDC